MYNQEDTCSYVRLSVGTWELLLFFPGIVVIDVIIYAAFVVFGHPLSTCINLNLPWAE